jgi:hypothetical protein
MHEREDQPIPRREPLQDMLELDHLARLRRVQRLIIKRRVHRAGSPFPPETIPHAHGDAVEPVDKRSARSVPVEPEECLYECLLHQLLMHERIAGKPAQTPGDLVLVSSNDALERLIVPPKSLPHIRYVDIRRLDGATSIHRKSDAVPPGQGSEP